MGKKTKTSLIVSEREGRKRMLVQSMPEIDEERE
jgi:hypothetical protein